MNARTCTFTGLLVASLAVGVAPSAACAQDDAAVQTAAFELPELRLSLRGQIALVEDEAWQALADARIMGGGELALDVALGDRLFVGASYSGRALSGRTFALAESSLSGNAVRASAGWRWRPLQTLNLYGRAGVGAWWWDLTFAPDSVAHKVEAEAFRPGFFVGAGADVWLLGPEADAPATDGDRFALGINLELTYDRFLPVEFTHDGRSLGSIDPSGPGWLMGLVIQF